ncbi:hypothetical protein [Sphingomonas sp. SORGH_AS_0879]|uniref:hypothetical protein n=1 Tax=Sphingomonas sp. SORGH_AS_0879 TaxID=3041790 RepID=UPI00277D967D|nr:hypothetical protein [Sphingomonas sp. SORGH_AS_0879]MDQ1229314.1 hypothetical protein [Sphingomonas sp. SORGH_AS_0879]
MVRFLDRIALGPGQVPGFVPPQPVVRPASYPKAGDLVFGLSPYRTVGNSTTTLAYAPASGALNEVSDNFMTAQPAGHRFVYLNFGFNSADSGGPTALETPPGNSNTIDGSVTFTAANGGGTRVAGTFGGAASIVMPDGGFAIEDARPAFGGGWHRVSLTTPGGRQASDRLERRCELWRVSTARHCLCGQQHGRGPDNGQYAR